MPGASLLALLIGYPAVRGRGAIASRHRLPRARQPNIVCGVSISSRARREHLRSTASLLRLRSEARAAISAA